MKNKTALITGSTSGIGRATAVALARRGAHVVVSGRHTDRGAEVVDSIRAEGGQADFVGADLSDARSATELAIRATEIAKSAGGTLDILVNNAAIGAGGPTSGTEEAVFDAVLATNLKAPFYLVGHLAPAMASREGAPSSTSRRWQPRAPCPGCRSTGRAKRPWIC